MSYINGGFFFPLMIKPSDPLLSLAGGKNSQVYYFLTKIDALIQPHFIVKYSLLLFFFFFKRSGLRQQFLRAGGSHGFIMGVVLSGCDSRLAGGPAVIQEWPLPSHTHTDTRAHAHTHPLSVPASCDCWPSSAVQGCASFLFSGIKKLPSSPIVSVSLS